MTVFVWIYKLICWSLGFFFVYAGTLKLLAPIPFAILIEAYGILPEGLIMPVALVLPALEVVAGIGLFLDIRGSLMVISGLLVLFIVILGYGIWMGLDVDCGCFGPNDPEVKAFHGLRVSLYRDLVMLLGAAFIYGLRIYRTIKPKSIRRVMDKLIQERSTKDAFG